MGVGRNESPYIGISDYRMREHLHIVSSEVTGGPPERSTSRHPNAPLNALFVQINTRFEKRFLLKGKRLKKGLTVWHRSLLFLASAVIQISRQASAVIPMSVK
jgi:hypothetical protein